MSSHNQPINRVQLSYDGVQESKSSAISLDMYTVKFNCCRNIYPLLCIKPYNRYKFNEQFYLKSVVTELNENNITIEDAICDNPKRSVLRSALSHSSLYACEYCESSAESYINEEIAHSVQATHLKIENQIKKIDEEIEYLRTSPGSTHRKQMDEDQINLLHEFKNELVTKSKMERNKIKIKHLVWPVNTVNGQARTMNAIIDISRAITTGRNSDEESEELTREERKGIVGPSVFLHQPNFNMINNIPAEYMHLACLGIVRRLLELTFSVGEKRDRRIKRKLGPPSLYNKLIANARVPHEFSRRGRHLDLSVMKAQEMRNIALFFFPLILQCFKYESNESEHHIWLLLGFILRACVIPDDEFMLIDSAFITQCTHRFYTLFQNVYGKTNCSYSVHVFCSHLLQIRGNVPLTFRSAFPFESFYGEMKNSFCPGTQSTLKQILRNVIMKRCVETHVCEKSIHFKPDRKPKNGQKPKLTKECNDLVYTFQSPLYNFFKIMSINDDDDFVCSRIGKYQANFPLPEIDWSTVGVFRLGPISCDTVILHRNALSGKLIKIGKYVMTCPMNILREK